MKNMLCKLIITAGKSKAVIVWALNINVSMIHEAWKAFEKQRGQMTESLRRSTYRKNSSFWSMSSKAKNGGKKPLVCHVAQTVLFHLFVGLVHVRHCQDLPQEPY